MKLFFGGFLLRPLGLHYNHYRHLSSFNKEVKHAKQALEGLPKVLLNREPLLHQQHALSP